MVIYLKGMLNSVSMIVGELAKDIETYSLYPGENQMIMLLL